MLLAVCLSLVFSTAASAFTVSSFSINPRGSLTQCEAVSGNFTITLSPNETGTLPSVYDGEFFTDIDHPDWSVILFSDGVETSRVSINNKTFFLSSLNMTGSGNPGSDRTLQVSFSGWTLPEISQPTNLTVLSIRELDTTESQTESTEKFLYTPFVVDCACICLSPSIPDLKPFQTDIDENSSLGIDTTEAEAKYNEAQQDIASARARPKTQFAEAYNDLDAAKAAINQGETALDKAWAESEVANARVPINNADAVIAWFKGNSSTANNPDLAQIIAERDLAANYLSAANDEITSGNYSAARANAQEAYEMGNESYSDALHDQDASHCLGCDDRRFLIPYIAAGIGVFALLIAGIVWWKKRPGT
ncbi:MAG: hypothetical protein WBL42_10190 [Methanoregula sp.]